MTGGLQFAIAFAVLVATWLVLRRQAGGGRLVAVPLDVAPIILGWLLLLGVAGRPVMAAVLVAAAGAGLALTDAVKRSTLLEPLVFADRAELLEVVRHPRLYLPFAGPVRVVGGAVAAVAAVGALVWVEPAAAHPGLLVMGLLVGGLVWLPTSAAVLPRLAKVYRRLGTVSEPEADMRRFGFLASLIVQATLARAERPGRQAAVAPFPAPPAGRNGAASGGPVVVVQIESFFDVGRLGPGLVAGGLPYFGRMRREGLASGLLHVPCWGANTVRTEFAVLTGIGQAALGLDRFNPYERFAQVKLRSLAWEMKAAGYRTICLHPFDKRFYARNRVMGLLGFDAFIGLEAFAGAERVGPYVSDEAVAAEIVRIVAAEGPRLFVFAMTMANHGPWDGGSGEDGLGDDGRGFEGLPERAALGRFVAGVRRSDAMLGMLMDGLPGGSLLAAYGDHQPSLPGAFAALGLSDQRTDYAIWRAPDEVGDQCSGLGTAGMDLRAEDLPGQVLQHAVRVAPVLAAAAQ